MSNPLFKTAKEAENVTSMSRSGRSDQTVLLQQTQVLGSSNNESTKFLNTAARTELHKLAMANLEIMSSKSTDQSLNSMAEISIKDGFNIELYSSIGRGSSSSISRDGAVEGGGRSLRETSFDFQSDIESGRSTQRGDGRVGREAGRAGMGSFELGSSVESPIKVTGRFLQKKKETGDGSSRSGDEEGLDFSDREQKLRDLTTISEFSDRSSAMADPVRVSPLSRNPSAFQQDPTFIQSTDKVTQPPKTENIKIRPTLASNGALSSTDEGGLRQRKNLTVQIGDPPPAPWDRTQTAVKIPTAHARDYDRLKSKSRLAEPAPPAALNLEMSDSFEEFEEDRMPANQTRSLRRSGQPPQTPGGLKNREEEEDNFLKEIDLPEKYFKKKWNIWTILELSAFIIILIALICSILVPHLRLRRFWGLRIWKWVLMVMIIFCGGLLSAWIVKIIVFFVEKNFLLRKRVLYFVFSLQKGVHVCMWLMFVLLAWFFVLDSRVNFAAVEHKALKYVTKVLFCFLLGAFIWVVKILCVKVLASNYHVSTYFDRIHESLFNQHVLETLSGPPDREFQSSFNETNLKAAGMQVPETPGLLADHPKQATMPRKSGVIGAYRTKDEGNDGFRIEHLQKMTQKNISAWNMKKLVNIVMQTGISTLTHTLDATDDDADGKTGEIEYEWQAKIAAKQVLKNVARPGRKEIDYSDLLRFMPEDEASKAMKLFDEAPQTGKITQQCFVNWVVTVYKERKALALSLKDTRTAVRKLHRLIDVLVAFLIIIMWLLVLGVTTTHLIVFVSSQLLLAVFIFGNTCKLLFEAIVFLFVVHPFDVGDRCIVDGVQMVVEEMNILSTVFLRYDMEKIYYPNSLLATKPISNLFRSPDMADSFDFSVHFSTPLSRIAELKTKIGRYLESKPHHWYPTFSLNMKEILDMNKMKMTLVVKHKMNHHNAPERFHRNSELLLEVRNYFQQLKVEYHLLPQEVHVRNV